MNEHDTYDEWDAAYVLGALSPTERREYESHLAECSTCRAAVAELIAMPGLLAAVPSETALALPDSMLALSELGQTNPTTADVAAPNVLPRLITRIHRRRRRVRMVFAGIAFASLAATVGITMVATMPGPGFGQSQSASPSQGLAPLPEAAAIQLKFTPEVASALTATGTVMSTPWGTQIDWVCRYVDTYASSRGPSIVQDYSLVVTDRSGQAVPVASWQAGPGSTVTPTATTSVALSDIRSLDIRVGETGPVLLAATP